MAEKRASSKTASRRVFDHPRKRPKMFRAGLYARVSTDDQQTIPWQLRGLREYAARRGWTVAMQVKEIGCGASVRELRTEIIAAARRPEIDVVLVWRLDRWGRSVTDLLATLQELEHLGVGFVSLTEALDLTTPTGRAFGDSWEHGLVLEKRLSRDPNTAYPVCTGGQLACPPEHCGGIGGFYDLLDALGDPAHDQYDELRDWVGDDYDPDAFSVDDVNRMLAPFHRRRHRSKASKN